MNKERYKTLSLHVAVALVLLFSAIFVLISGWVFGFEFKLIAFLLVGFTYGTRYSLKINKTWKDRAKVSMVFSFVIVEVLAMLEVRPVSYFAYFALACGICWIVLELIDQFKLHKSSQKRNYVLIIGLSFLIYYVAARFLFWPLLSIVFLAGILLICIAFFIEHFKYKKSNII